MAAGIEIFLLGLAKKLVLADGLARFADPGFAAAARHDPLTLIEAWVALLAYALQIYFDFSGYSDMAIGLARMFGIDFPVNFNSPYQARNIGDFWRRWNITLSGFLRDYLYIPLGGNRRGEARRIVNLMITMLLGGLWHGAGLRFVLWGGLHGALSRDPWLERASGPAPSGLVSWLLTLLAVLLAWVPFRADGFAAAMQFYRGLFGFNGIAIPSIYIKMLPVLGHFGRAVPVLPYLGDARTLSLPQAVLLPRLGLVHRPGLPELHRMSERRGEAQPWWQVLRSACRPCFSRPIRCPFCIFSSDPCGGFLPPARLSVALYLLVFAALVDRPLSLGLLRLEIVAKNGATCRTCPPRNWSSSRARTGHIRIPAW